jgi:ribosome maturation factor RimP
VTVEDCGKVTRQLQFALRGRWRRVPPARRCRRRVLTAAPAGTQRDCERFVGFVVDITLEAPIGAAAQGQVETAFAGSFVARWSARQARRPQPAGGSSGRDEPPVKPESEGEPQAGAGAAAGAGVHAG